MIRVLVVDDSALLRKIIRDILSSDPGIEVVDTAANGQLAVSKVRELKPDIVTLDVDMPVMDGFTALKKIMAETPCPVIMLSGLTQAGANLTFKCLEAGAVDYFPKPIVQGPHGLQELAAELIAKVRGIYAHRRIRAVRPPASRPVALAAAISLAPAQVADRVVAIGISTGGPAALAQIFPQLPETFPPVLVVQHMPKEFTGAFAERLNKLTKLRVKEAQSGDPVEPGLVLVAPGDHHLVLQKKNGGTVAALLHSDKVDGHRPSASVLFKSVAEHYRERAIGVIMTGMGRDGVDGLKEMRAAGAKTVGQDQATSVVYGMPGIAAKEQVLDHVEPLDGIIGRLGRLLQ